jgi:translation initiation factor 2 subunit 2
MAEVVRHSRTPHFQNSPNDLRIRLTDEMQAERKPRKSVQFEDSTTIVDSDGQVTEGGAMNGDKDSAASHATGTNAHHAGSNNIDFLETGEDKEVDEVTDMFAGLAKKVWRKQNLRRTLTNQAQKKKKPKADAEGEDAEDVLSGLKKKKKSKKPKAETDDFDAQLAAVAGETDEKEAPADEEVEEGDMMKGTGVWQHDSTTVVPYNMLLNRFFTLLHSQHPDLASSGSKSYKIPPPQCLREGNKKTIFANISEICKRMKRTDEHGT